MRDRELRDAVAMQCFADAYKAGIERQTIGRFVPDPEETADQALIRRKGEIAQHFQDMAATAFIAADAFLAIWELN